MRSCGATILVQAQLAVCSIQGASSGTDACLPAFSAATGLVLSALNSAARRFSALCSYQLSGLLKVVLSLPLRKEVVAVLALLATTVVPTSAQAYDTTVSTIKGERSWQL